jgi:hypothetical protein
MGGPNGPRPGRSRLPPRRPVGGGVGEQHGHRRVPCAARLGAFPTSLPGWGRGRGAASSEDRLANELPDAFTNYKGVTKSFIPDRNAPE